MAANTPVQTPAEIEYTRLMALLSPAGPERREALEPIVREVAWMRMKLEESRAKIKSAAIVVKYNNGGGQSGYRENPWFKAYEALWKSYLSGMDKILAALPAETAQAEKESEEAAAPKNVIEIVKARRAQ